MTVRELAEEVIRLTGSASRIEHKPERLGDVKHSLAAADKLRAAGWTPRHSVAEGLEATVAYFRSLKA
jgi:UDP-glucose 4-epimerase